MARYFLEIQYDGTAYHGWQVQPNGISVEEVIEGVLRQLFQQDVDIVGSGRTDAGVHALQQFAHLDVDELKFSLDEWMYKMNRMLPHDISIAGILPVTGEAHARFDAIRRTYFYDMHIAKDPFLRNSSWWLNAAPDIDRMNEACEVMKTFEDFSSFCKSNTDVKTMICKIYDARWEMTEQNRLRFVITADRFLRNMVRAVTGTMVNVGRGVITVDDFRKIIERRDRKAAGESAPARGLFLAKVEYPETIFIC